MTHSQRKGKAGELEVCKMLERHGFRVRRTPQSGGWEFKGDVWGAKDFHIEVKRVERLDLPKAWKQATQDASVTQTPVVVHRRSNEEWLATVRAEDLFGMAAELRELREAAQRIEGWERKGFW